MPKDPTEIVTDFIREIGESNHPQCTLLQPIAVHYEYVLDHVGQDSYWVTSSDAMDDCYGTGETEETALFDLLEAYRDNLEWYETGASEHNEMLDESYHRLREYIRVAKKR